MLAPTVKVQVSDLKQWRQEAEQLGRSEKYLNKIDRINDLAKQKAGAEGAVMLKPEDYGKMKGDRQEFKKQAQAQNQTQTRGMRM